MSRQVPTVFVPLLLLLFLPMQRLVAGMLDPRRALATKTRYAFRTAIPGAPLIYTTPDPPDHTPIHLWLLSRHGTRWPTKPRMQQISSLENLFKDARNTAQYPWISGWRSPVAMLGASGGELHPIGEEELWAMGRRLRARFPSISAQKYLPSRFPIQSTQVARAAASASAFALGFFPSHELRNLTSDGAASAHVSEEDDLMHQLMGHQLPVAGVTQHNFSTNRLDQTSKRPQAVAITMDPKHSDPLLRPFEMCAKYAQREELLEKWLASWLARNWSTLAPAIEERLHMSRPVEPCEVDGLWQLCQFEAGLHGDVSKACSLFTEPEIKLLNWLDDVDLLESHAWGDKVNYLLASPLLLDLRASLKAAAAVKKVDSSIDSGHHGVAARLLFAHCETLVPLATLLGLFEPDLPPPPPVTAGLKKQDIDQLAPEGEARALLAAADSTEDLRLSLSPLTQQQQKKKKKKNGLLTAGRQPGADVSAAQPGSGLISEGVDTCYGSKIPKTDIPTPVGWYPRTPFRDNRTFTAVQVSPYGANLAIVLYRHNKADGSSLAGHRVRLLYNEQVVPVPGCTSGAGPQGVDCDLEEFLELTSDRADPSWLQNSCAGSSSR